MNKTVAALILLGIVGFAVYKYRQPRFMAGEMASDFSVVLQNGNTVKLSDFKGKYTLLQFWGSWCGPCRAENPYIKKCYEKYQDKGFTVLSIGIERNSNAWKKALENDGMIWPNHAMESQNFDGPVATAYNIKSIPATFLINPEGQIMGVNLRHEIIDQMLTDALIK